MVSSANIFSDWLICGISAKFIISASFGGFVGLFAIAIEKKFMSWIERKLSSLLSESIKVSASMPKKIYWTVFGIWGISLFFAIMLSELLL